MNDKIKEYIKHELLAREGFRRGLNEFPSVRYWVKIWYENFLYQAIRNDELNFIDNSDRNDSVVSSNESFDQYNEKPQSAYKKFVERTISLSDEYVIEIDQNMFNSIEQGNINLFVLRNLGFGGQIAGVPASHIFIDWYLEKRKRELQNL